ncbi:hypothetical protein HK103_007064 [Boothiomyces macroporosus]|uniref:DUF3752 domain-containing protein n=1 Tax=Boothiomyces macroporosus TaxID=261099 RepID=A0AAD5UGA7_9FUNG|nr:hypothetical protein HK103_007064 [Boothiomyces macroporosus]
MERFGPSLPPHLQKQRESKTIRAAKPETPVEESESDDDYGPVLPDVDEKKRKPIVDAAPKKKPKEEEREEKPKSLLEEFQENMYKSKSYKADDLSHKRFDRERDIVGRRMDTKSRDDILNDAKNLSSKFSKGSN